MGRTTNLESYEIPAPDGSENLIIKPSAKRNKTISARRSHGQFEVLVPASLPRKTAERYAVELWEKLQKKETTTTALSDEALAAHAEALRQKYLPEAAAIASIRWVTNQKQRWGSCSSSERAIRLSHELINMPQYVQDAVLVHEIAHLLEPNHGPEFKQLENRFPRRKEAKAFLAGYALAKNQDV